MQMTRSTTGKTWPTIGKTDKTRVEYTSVEYDILKIFSTKNDQRDQYNHTDNGQFWSCFPGFDHGFGGVNWIDSRFNNDQHGQSKNTKNPQPTITIAMATMMVSWATAEWLPLLDVPNHPSCFLYTQYFTSWSPSSHTQNRFPYHHSWCSVNRLTAAVLNYY